MHKQPIKEVEVRTVVFQDITLSISVQKNNPTPMLDSPTYVHPYTCIKQSGNTYIKSMSAHKQFIVRKNIIHALIRFSQTRPHLEEGQGKNHQTTHTNITCETSSTNPSP